MKTTHRMLIDHLKGLNSLATEFGANGQPVGTRKLPIKIAVNSRKTRKSLTEALNEYDEFRLEGIRPFVKMKKDESGNDVFATAIEKDASGREQEIVVFKSKKAEEEFAVWHKELLDTPVEVKVHRIAENDLMKLGDIEDHVLGEIEFFIHGFGDPYDDKSLTENEDG